MLAERVQEWTKQWREEGRAELLKRQLELKFGLLDEQWCRRLSEADADRLLAWGERVLTAGSLEDVFV